MCACVLALVSVCVLLSDVSQVRDMVAKTAAKKAMLAPLCHMGAIGGHQ